MPQTLFSSGIRDNHSRGSVADFLKKTIKVGSNLSVVSAFFTVYAYEALKDVFDKIDHMDFLFGEPRFIRSLDPEKTDKKAFVIDSTGLKLTNTLKQKRAAKDCAEWIESKVSIKSVKQVNFLHGKMYHIASNEVTHAILGSSNFTTHGLGASSGHDNIELNLIVDSDRDRLDLKAWFDNLWNNEDLVEDVKQDVLQYLAQLYQNHAPEFIYYKTLFHVFDKYLSDASKTDLDIGRTTLFETDIWKTLFGFQKDGVKGAINKILTHNGCILADSVGLGKTYSALAVIKFFELKNERALVLCPKKLRENWTVYRSNDRLNPFTKDRFRYDVLSHTDLSRESGYSGDINLETLNWGNYDLVVIDESHNFRNNKAGKRDENGNIVRMSRYERLMQEIIKSGIKTKVLLLSATPVNNDLKDLRNQIYFITAGDDGAFKESIGVSDIKESLRQAQSHFSAWAKQPSVKRKTGDLLQRLGSDFFKLLDQLTIARARKHIQKYYSQEMKELGNFPTRLKPLALSPEIDSDGLFISYDRLSSEIDEYKLSLFNPTKFLRKDLPVEIKTEYEGRVGNFTQATREDFLIGMMKVNFLKRLESSVYSFALTLERTMAKITTLEEKLKAFQAFKKDNPEIDFDTLSPEETDDEELQEALQVGKKLVFKTAHMDVEKWLKALHKDRQQLNNLYLQAKDVNPARDAKLAELKELISQKVRHPAKNKKGDPVYKVLVFTAFADTADYLYENLHSWALKELKIHTALVTGGNFNKTTYQPKGYKLHTDFNHILTNFSPISKRRSQISTLPQEGEIDLLIATDCISEGQNLQDCDYLINYDIHWNPVRIIQRFGRIDRIGSLNQKIQLVNFWPTANLDQYITLKHRVEARMALVDIAATLEDNLLKQDDLQDLIKDDLKYRDRQLVRLKDEVLDLEDLSDTISLTEFSLDDFRVDLLKYLEANRALLEGSPFGIYTVVPPHPTVKTIAPGVVYCLRQRVPKSGEEACGSNHVNPLSPYFLVYVLADGNVRFGFANPKQILGLYRELCVGNSSAYENLCNMFDQETQDGSDMSHYSFLLQKAVDSITHLFQKRVTTALQSGRSFIIPDADSQVSESTDFELVTWLVIKEQL